MLTRTAISLFFAIFVTAAVAVIIISKITEHQLFDIRKLEIALASDMPVPVSAITRQSTSIICIFNPYQNPEPCIV